MLKNDLNFTPVSVGFYGVVLVAFAIFEFRVCFVAEFMLEMIFTGSNLESSECIKGMF